MSDIQPQYADDLVRRAIAVMRQLPESCGPAAALVSQTSAALHQAALRPKASLLERINHMPWISKTSALLGVAATVLVMYVMLSNSTNCSRAFAAMAEVLNSVHSATWKSTQTIITPDSKTTTFDVVGMFLAPLHERMEQLPARRKAKRLRLSTVKKTK